MEKKEVADNHFKEATKLRQAVLTLRIQPVYKRGVG